MMAKTPPLLELISPIELEILQSVQKGLSSHQIAKIRNCSPRTIEKHRSNIIKKLKIKSTQNALLLWVINKPQILNT